jgi:hypothetical protein
MTTRVWHLTVSDDSTAERRYRYSTKSEATSAQGRAIAAGFNAVLVEAESIGTTRPCSFATIDGRPSHVSSNH